MPKKAQEESSETKSEMVQQLFNQVHYMHSNGIDMLRGELYLFGREEHASGHGDAAPGEPGIEYTLANQFIRNYNFLRNGGDDTPILTHMKSCGGYWNEGMAIYDTIKMSPNPAIILVYTHAQSMTSIILLAADKRVMMPHSTYMIHRGTWGGHLTGTQLDTEYLQWKRTEEQMFRIYIDNLKRKGRFKRKSEKTIRDWLMKEMKDKEEVYFTAEEAVEIGFADEVFDGDWERLKEI